MAITFYATNNFTGDGTTVNWNINFADGYIDTTNVKARYLDNTGSYVDIAISSVVGNVVTISPAVANGQEFQIYRDTEKRFPLVDFSDGAILNETNLDTLANQAVMVSAEAFDQSNNGVRIAGDSLVVAQGIDAKAQTALDNSDAAVATANAIDGKAQTALDSAAAAVATATAAASTAAGAVTTANTALATANDAADDAATAITTANGAVTTANTATTTANAASAAAAAATTTANNAANDAANAVSTAGTALSTANTASTNASAAVTTANAAKATAEGIEAKADSALAASATAVSTANSAEATANAIDGKATDALNTADSAVDTANAATSTANSAVATANAASSTASSAAADASTALSTANAIDAKAQTALDNTVSLDAATMKKAANLSDIANKAAAWLNVRPTGATPLAAGPVSTLDAATKGYVDSLRQVDTTWTSYINSASTPSTGTAVTGGALTTSYRIAGSTLYSATFRAYGTIGGADTTIGASLSTPNGASYRFTNAGRLQLPSGGSIASDDNTLSLAAAVSAISLYANAQQQVGIRAANANVMFMTNTDGNTVSGYVNYIQGNWNSAFWQLGGVRGSGANLDNVTLTVKADGSATPAVYQFYGTGTAVATQWQSTSDERIKSDIKRIDRPLEKMRNIRGVSWNLRINDTPGYGFIAQDVQRDFPGAVDAYGSRTLTDGTVVENVLSVNTSGVAAALHHEAILALMDKVAALEARIAELTSQ